MGAGQSNLEEMLGSVGDIYDDTPSRADQFVEVGGLVASVACARLVPATEPRPVREDKRLDERLQRAISLAATLELAPPGETAAEETEAEETEAEETAAEETEAGAEAGVERVEATEAETEGDSTDSADDTDSAGESDDEPDGAGFTIATCARAMGFEPRRLYPATAETLARAVCTGHAIVAVRSEAEDAQVVVFRGCVVEGGVAASFEATIFGSGGASSTESVAADDLRFMYGFWHVPRAHRGHRGDEAEEE
jgi:hypothetical protein